MGVSENIAAVRADANTNSQNFFIYYFQKFPQAQNMFPDYQGKSAADMKALPKFSTHPAAVVGLLLQVVEKAGDAGALKAEAQKLAKMPQHTKLNGQHFKDLFCALNGFLADTLGGAFDKAGWEAAGNAVCTAVAAAM